MTLVDMPKVAQMLDNGWSVRLFRNDMGSYTAEATHDNPVVVARANRKILDLVSPEMRHVVEEFQEDDSIETDDFTPEQALTRLAYKVHGEILSHEH